MCVCIFLLYLKQPKEQLEICLPSLMVLNSLLIIYYTAGKGSSCVNMREGVRD